jgi:hypothetical protein
MSIQAHSKCYLEYGYTISEFSKWMNISKDRINQLMERKSPRLGQAKYEMSRKLLRNPVGV